MINTDYVPPVYIMKYATYRCSQAFGKLEKQQAQSLSLMKIMAKKD